MTRAHGLHTHLITRADYQAILKAKDAKSVSEYLMKGDYAKLLESVSAEYPIALSLTKAFHSLLVSRCYYLVKLAPKRSRRLLEAYLERFLVEDMKRILRAKHSERVVDKASLIPVPKGYDYANLPAMIDAATLQDAVELLKATRYRSVADGLPIYEKHRLISVIEALIDRAYFDSELIPALRRLPGGGMVREMVGTEVDLMNIKTMADLKARRVTADAVRSLSFLPMRLEPEVLTAISGTSVDSIPQLLSKTQYAASAHAIRDALEPGKDESLDHIVRQQVYNQTKSMMFPHFGSFAYVFGYVREAEAECNNLVSIVTGKELGLDEARIQASLCV